MAAAIDTRRLRSGKQFGAILVLVAMGYLLGGASGVLLKTAVPVGPATINHATAPAIARFDTTLKAGERQASQADQYGPSSDLTRVLPAAGQNAATNGSVVASLGALAPGFGGPMVGIDAGQSVSTGAAAPATAGFDTTLKAGERQAYQAAVSGGMFHEPGSRLGGNQI